MALEATHIRFALDVRDEFGIADVSRYLSGAIYPDSRYLTRVSRDLTHPKDFGSIPLPKDDDFRKGWETHLIYDLIQGDVFAERTGKKDMVFGDEEWRVRTVFKVVQNGLDLAALDMSAVPGCLNVILTPFGESEEAVRTYFRSVSEFFEAGWTGIDEMPVFRAALSSDSDGTVRNILEDLAERYSDILGDAEAMDWLAGVYDETLRRYRAISV
ncbi:MAG: hypothetical protein HGB18_05440 [Candidatus Moranbacteria bacterium]|nr:hypothetical protein [Candidatus Moranbacteria bacterium]